MTKPVWPQGMPRKLDYPPVGAPALLAGAAHAFPERVALVHGEETLTYQELFEQAQRLAGGLRERGIGPGDVVALQLPNSHRFMVAYFGVLCAGAAAAPLNPAQPAENLHRQLKTVGAKAMITQSSKPDEFPAAKPFSGYAAGPDELAQLLLTGGTTGRSKAVRVLHRHLVANALQVTCWRSHSLPELDGAGGVRLRPVPEAVTAHSVVPGEAVSIAVAPLFHSLGVVGYLCSVLYGATVIVHTRFDPAAVLADIERYRVTNIAGSPAMFHALLRSPALGDHDLSSMRHITSGAAPIDSTALARLREVFPEAFVGEGYGLSEATMGVTSALTGAHPAPVGSVGVPTFDTEIEIRDPMGGKPLPVGETGEVWVRGPQVADGYHEAPQETRQQFRDGWLDTGDLGYVDAQGYLFLAGRTKDMVLYKGYNVYPQPLEEILCTHPDIVQAAVVGAPSPEAGEIPVAFVVTRPGAVVDDGFAASVMAFLAAKVVPYQRVRALHVVPALPLTATGKVLKTELRSRLR